MTQPMYISGFALIPSPMIDADIVVVRGAPKYNNVICDVQNVHYTHGLSVAAWGRYTCWTAPGPFQDNF